MKPSQLVSQLRRIASAIDNSKNPDRTLVARDLKRVLSAVSGPMRCEVSFFDGGGYGPGDIIGVIPSFSGPFWAGAHGFGWVSTNKDPSTIGDLEPIKTPDLVYLGINTWGDVKKHLDLSESLKNMKYYASADDFAADPYVLYWMCSGSKDDAAGIKQALTEAGFDAAAAKVDELFSARDLERVIASVSRVAAYTARAITWDEISDEWSDHGTFPISGPIGPDQLNEINRKIEENNVGFPLEDDEIPEWEIKSVHQVPDLSVVTPGDYFPEKRKRQSFLSGPGSVVIVDSGKQYGLLLVQ